MADKPKTNVDKFFEIYDADPALQARVQQAMDCYPGSLEIRDVMTYARIRILSCFKLLRMFTLSTSFFKSLVRIFK